METTTEITPDLEKIKETLSKIHRLAEQGIDGEKEVAKSKLEKLLQKYNLSIDDVVDNDEKDRTLKYKKGNDGDVLMTQVVWSVKSNAKIYKVSSQYSVVVSLKYAEYIEVFEKYKYYWKHYIEERNAFLKAYLYRHRLHSAFEDSEYKEPSSDKEKEEVRKIRKMMFSMDKSEYVNTNKLLQDENV